MARALTYVFTLSSVGAIYFLLAHFWLELAALYPGAMAISPPAGFALAAVLLGGYRVVPALFAAAYMADPGWSDPGHAAAIATSAAGNALEAFAGGVLVDGWAGGRNVFAAPAGVARFALIAIVVAMIGASIGSIIALGFPTRVDLAAVGAIDLGALPHIAELDWDKLAAVWFPRWLADLAALLIITPALVLWVTERPRALDLRGLPESSAILAAAAASATIAFGPFRQPPGAAPLAVLIVLPLIWAALRRGPRDTATAALVLLLFAGWGTLLGGGPLARSAREGAPALVLMLMIAMATPSLILAADGAQRRRSEKSLREARSELGQAREQFLQSQKMEAVGQLAGGVAHDFNNLLTVIVGNLSTAQRHLASLTEGPAEQLRRVVNNAMRGAERATTITRQLLAFSRKQPIEPKLLDINGVVRGLSDFLRRTLGETITLDIIAADDLWQAEADPVQLESAILNLAVNARHAMTTSAMTTSAMTTSAMTTSAMAPGGRLTIETQNSVLDAEYCRQHAELAAGSYVRIAVSDTGSGMSKEVLQRVFEPFFTTKKAGQGTGLGLSQVRGFVKQSNGHIEIDSEPGKGTTITIFLPALPGTVNKAPLAEPAPAFADAVPTILVVEDDHDVRACVVEILRDRHYRVLDAHDADSALAMIDRNDVHVDLLLADLVLPGMSGRQLARTVKARRPAVRVLFMTGYSREAIDDHWPVNAEGELLRKPLMPDALVSRVRTLLDRAR